MHGAEELMEPVQTLENELFYAELDIDDLKSQLDTSEGVVSRLEDELDKKNKEIEHLLADIHDLQISKCRFCEKCKFYKAVEQVGNVSFAGLICEKEDSEE